MSGDSDNAHIWADADVYVGPLTATIPADGDTPFDGTWDLVGLLDGDAGFEEDRARDTSDFIAWGQILVRTSRRNFVLTRKFTALETNATVAGLIWPGSGPGNRKVPDPNAKFLIAFETWDGDTHKRTISALRMEVEEVAAITEQDSDITKYEITVKIYPTSDGTLWIIQGDDELASDAPTLVSITTAATHALAVGAYWPIAVTAHWSDASTSDVSHLATLVSATPAKATVDRGYVFGVAAGTSNVTASYQGQNAVTAFTVS